MDLQVREIHTRGREGRRETVGKGKQGGSRRRNEKGSRMNCRKIAPMYVSMYVSMYVAKGRLTQNRETTVQRTRRPVCSLRWHRQKEPAMNSARFSYQV